MSISTENFIKTIYQLEDSQAVKLNSTELALRLKISKAAVTDMLKKLGDQGLVVYERYSKPKLTQEGRSWALRIIRKHRLWETFLHTHLNIPWEKIHPEAEKLEHASSEYLTDHLEKFMNYPSRDPHGDPIPDKSGNMAVIENQLLLSEVKDSGNYKISRITDYDPGLIEFLKKHRLGPGSQIKIKVSENNFPGVFWYKKQKIKVSGNLDKMIFVEPIE
ncbi:MAG: metal-dependent transcriptional regulator [Bacteroidales bacterium]